MTPRHPLDRGDRRLMPPALARDMARLAAEEPSPDVLARILDALPDPAIDAAREAAFHATADGGPPPHPLPGSDDYCPTIMGRHPLGSHAEVWGAYNDRPWTPGWWIAPGFVAGLAALVALAWGVLT